MDQILRNLWVTTTLPDEVPTDVERVFVFDESVDPVGQGGPGNGPTDTDWTDDVDVHWTDDADVEHYETFATLADDVLYSLKAGHTALVVRRPDAALTAAVVAKRDNRTHSEAVTSLAETGPEPDHPGEPLSGHVRRYVNE
jgi:hypothetical protein